MSLIENRSQRVHVAVVYVAAMFMTILTTTIVNVALPTIGQDLDARSGAVALVPIAYLVALTVFIPTAAWIGDRVGGRRALLGAAAVFTAGSALCAGAQSIGWLIAASALMGVGGAVLTPVGLAMLFRVYPPDDRVRVSSLLALFTSIAPALGPVLGGVLTSFASWRWVYLVDIPVGVAVLVYGWILLAAHRTDRPGPLDVPGLGLSLAGLGLLILGISAGPVLGWTSPVVLLAVVAGAILVAVLIVVELRRRAPLVDIRLFANRTLAAATSLYALGSVAYIGALFVAALFLQDALGFSAVTAGLLTLPSALGVMAGGQLVGRVLLPRWGGGPTIATGLTVVAVGLVVLATATAATPIAVLGAGLFVLGLGTALVFITAQATSMTTVSKADTGRAASLYNAGKQLGSALGVALASTLIAAGGSGAVRGALAPVGGYHLAFAAEAVVALASIPVALAGVRRVGRRASAGVGAAAAPDPARAAR